MEAESGRVTKERASRHPGQGWICPGVCIVCWSGGRLIRSRFGTRQSGSSSIEDVDCQFRTISASYTLLLADNVDHSTKQRKYRKSYQREEREVMFVTVVCRLYNSQELFCNLPQQL